MRRICHVEFKPSTLLFAIRFSEWQGLWRMRRIRHVDFKPSILLCIEECHMIKGFVGFVPRSRRLISNFYFYI
jgi:hypothetical protein